MAVPTLDFRFSNAAAWSTAFGLTRTGAAALPWAGVPVYEPGGAFKPGACCTDADDFYFADPAVVTAPWIGAATRADDVDARGLPRWRLFGQAEGYRAVPWDLSLFSDLALAIKTCDAAGNILDPRAKLTIGTADGTLRLTNPVLGGLQFAVPSRRVRQVPAALHRYDLVGFDADRERHRLKYGFLLVDDGIVS